MDCASEASLLNRRTKLNRIGGVKVPFTIRYSGIDTFNSWTRTFTEIKRNTVVEDTLFAIPAAPPK